MARWFYKRGSDVAQGQKSGAPSKDQTHYSFVIVFAKQASYYTTSRCHICLWYLIKWPFNSKNLPISNKQKREINQSKKKKKEKRKVFLVFFT